MLDADGTPLLYSEWENRQWNDCFIIIYEVY
jgi:hypothetical protein